MEVIETVLNNPVLVTQADNVDYLTKHGKGWVCEIDKQIVRFSVVGLVQRNVWALLFVMPEFEWKTHNWRTSRSDARKALYAN